MIASALLAWALSQTPAAPSLPPSTVALVETYADGRAQYELTSAKPAWSWTITFPRLKDWQQPAGSLPVRAVQFDRVLAGDGVKVDVSVLLGPQHQRVMVDSVVVHDGAHVLITRLREYGVEPVDLSLAQVAPMTPYLPTVFSTTPNIEITAVALLSAPYPGYRVTVRNLSAKTAANFRVRAYAASGKSMSFIPRGPEGRPVLTPGGSHTFDVNLASGAKVTDGAWSPTPMDTIEIHGVLWDDGSADGPLEAASTLIAPDAGGRLQFTRIVAVLRKALDGPAESTALLDRVRSEVIALRDQDDDQLAAAQANMRAVKAAALQDLTRYQLDRSRGRAAADRRWLENLVRRYERTIDRLAQ